MKKMLRTVTVTGADDSADTRDLVRLREQYPFVEFGILLSKAFIGSARFPSLAWIDQLPANLPLAGHLCGHWVNEIFEGGWPKELRPFRSARKFRRWQLNTHGIPHQVNLDALARLVADLRLDGQTVIFQNDQANDAVIQRFTGCSNAAALFDLSHGGGVLPNAWPRPIDNLACGYAGGLAPHNVAVQLARLQTLVGNHQIWIDAETHLRSRDDTIFDIAKVDAF
jgi:hypothetical protein